MWEEVVIATISAAETARRWQREQFEAGRCYTQTHALPQPQRMHLLECRNCGAPPELNALVCSYCRSPY
jgi:hypothetical protein